MHVVGRFSGGPAPAVLLLLLLTGWMPARTLAQTAQRGIEQDREALEALYNATDGAQWTSKTNWLQGPVSSWHGVTVRDGRVAELQLAENNLKGTLPRELGQLTGLQQLILGNNKLSGTIPPALGRMSRLEALYLDFNQLTGAIPTELGDLSRLMVLHLANNQLTGAVPAELGQLTNLTHMELANNPGLCKPPDTFTGKIHFWLYSMAACTATEEPPSLAELVGVYERQPVDNFIFTGTMVQRGDRMHWTFGWDPDDGKGFDLIPDLHSLRLIPAENQFTYHVSGPRQFSLIMTDGQVEGFTYNEIKYTKRGFSQAKPEVRFVDNGDGTVTDNRSGLIWLKDANCAELIPPDHFEENFAFTRDDALKAAGELRDGMCGLTDGTKPGDWRLPTVAEFCGSWNNQPVGFCAGDNGLVDPAFKNPAVSNAKGDAHWTQGDVFTNIYYGDEQGYHTSTPSIPPDPSKESPHGNEQVWRVFLSWQGKWGGNGAWTLSFFPDARVWPVRTASSP